MIVQATCLRQDHIGRAVNAKARTDDGEIAISGVLRWFTMTSDTVRVAVEECTEDPEGDGAVEWEFTGDDILVLR